MINSEVILLKITIKEVLTKQDKSVYWLMKETGISKKALYDLVNNKTDGVSFLNLEKICKALNCTPNDIMDISI